MRAPLALLQDSPPGNRWQWAAIAVASVLASLLAGGPQALARTKDLLRRVPALPQAEAFDHFPSAVLR